MCSVQVYQPNYSTFINLKQQVNQVMTNLWLTIAVLYLSYASNIAQAYNASTTTEACSIHVSYSSCQEAYNAAVNCFGIIPASGEYNIFVGNELKKIQCDMETDHCGSKGWMKVAELDMTQEGSQCPAGLDEGTYGSKRLCGNRGNNICKSTMLSTSSVPYKEVCGFVAGYQSGTPDAFNGKEKTIDSVYLDGVSITHGKPRKHIWSYAGGPISGLAIPHTCPCNVGAPDLVATFVKDNWYCESGNPTDEKIHYQFFGDDVLWDGKKCTLLELPCCTPHPELPYFSTSLESTTTDDIELRICHDQPLGDEDVPIESYQFFVR